MTPFAIVFMSVSMLVVTLLAGYCLTRVIRGGQDSAGDGGDGGDR